ncbi:hypothetical protein [Jannaschia seohaensis]|uniref:Uncharacterized protein n=1 Tax=Jannaschia seohaensis TaxID=475081 RepID=A0A2Y9C1J2_9RHOB|nr:hypothetical protein [Jannaschia seohaensis]PWJ16889.1 hypothetical protein BCF38_1071 [Jannaschia seohaensis]SSA48072.1 hypothetical protein SAMN05421539_1071 [Jannaschia seohaensis]
MAESEGTTRGLDIEAVGRKVTAIYEPVVDCLAQVRKLARDFEEGIGTLDETQDGVQGRAVRDDADQAIATIAALRDTIGAAIGAISAPETDRRLRQLEALCQRFNNNGRELNALSSFMLITAANARGEVSVEGLVADLRQLSDRLLSESATIVDVVAQVHRVRVTSVRSLRQAHDLAHAHLTGEAGQADVAARGSAAAGASRDLSAMAKALSASVAEFMPRIVACMQHPDAFCQRCDHVARILAMRNEETVSGATRAALSRLAHAQIQDMRGELDRVQTDTRAALGQVAAACDRTILAFQEALRADTRLARMRARRARLDDARRSVEEIKRESDGALADLETCQAVFAEISGAFERLNRMRLAVRLSSLNADLSEQRAERKSPEMRSVTKAIGECAKSYGDAIEELKIVFGGLETVFSSARRDELGNLLTQVCDHIDSAGSDIVRLSAEVEALRAAQAACAATLQDLVSNARAAEARIASNSLTLEMLERIGGTLEGSGRAMEDGEADPDQIARAYGHYTIEREREVHRAALGLPASDADPEADATGDVEDDDPLASILF